MAFVVVVLGSVVVLLALAWGVDVRDRRSGRPRRTHHLWRDEIREHRRDVKAGLRERFLRSDVSWTRHHQRGEPRR